MLTDIEIAQNAEMYPIGKIAADLSIAEEDIEFYGHYKAKLSEQLFKKLENKPNGKLILVTAINPTPAGEGKTTVSVGLADALHQIGKKTVLALREPSLGPVFGIKGGAAGGGYAQVVPMEDINLHFTGDMHAITSANNLLCAMLDNHMQQGNTLRIDQRCIMIKRVLDMNDRALRNIVIGLGRKVDGIPRSDSGTVPKRLDIAKFGRAAAQSAKQSIKGDLREINRERILGEFQDLENDCITCQVSQVEPGGTATLLYNKTELYLFRNEQIPGEVLKEGQMVKVYITTIANKQKKPIIKISRVRKELVKRLFELEIPEIYDGTVEIKAISREAGSRTKVAVWSKDPNVDAIGACIGPKRARISAIVSELNGEKIDIIPYSEKPEEFIAKALAPATVLSVTILSEEDRTCTIVVPNNQLSLAIGNKGQNAKLAAKLTGYKIDIKPEFDVLHTAEEPKEEEQPAAQPAEIVTENPETAEANDVED